MRTRGRGGCGEGEERKGDGGLGRVVCVCVGGVLRRYTRKMCQRGSGTGAGSSAILCPAAKGPSPFGGTLPLSGGVNGLCPAVPMPHIHCGPPSPLERSLCAAARCVCAGGRGVGLPDVIVFCGDVPRGCVWVWGSVKAGGGSGGRGL